MINELRLGNFMSDGIGNMAAVTGINESLVWLNCLGFEDHELQPIPLTEDILLKFGFEKRTLRFLWQKDYIYFKKGICFWQKDLKCTYKSVVELDVKYVHQLQNLYFALMQTELVLKT